MGGCVPYGRISSPANRNWTRRIVSVSSVKCQVSSVKCQVSSARILYHTLGARLDAGVGERFDLTPGPGYGKMEMRRTPMRPIILVYDVDSFDPIYLESRRVLLDNELRNSPESIAMNAKAKLEELFGIGFVKGTSANG